MKKLYQRPVIRALITGILTIPLSISIGLLDDWSTDQAFFFHKFLFFLVSAILSIIHLTYNAAQGIKEKDTILEFENQMHAHEQALSGIIHISQETTNTLMDRINICQKTNKFPTETLFENSARQLCQTVYTILSNLTRSKDLEISYVCLTGRINNEIWMLSYANKNSQPPNLLKRPRIFSDSNIPQYHDMELFNNENHEINILLGSENINNHFHRTVLHKTQYPRKYNQYIGISVFCGTKMIGLLQIACLGRCSLGNNEEVILNLANRYLIPYSNLFLMMHKIDKALKCCSTKGGTNNGQSAS